MSIFEKFKFGLSKSSKSLSSGLNNLIFKKKIDKNFLDDLEDFLIESDVGVESAKELREKYNPDKILEAIDISYRTNYDKLRSSLSHPDNPLLKYNRETQISLLESAQQDNKGLIKEIADSLKDTVYFLTLSKNPSIIDCLDLLVGIYVSPFMKH